MIMHIVIVIQRITHNQYRNSKYIFGEQWVTAFVLQDKKFKNNKTKNSFVIIRLEFSK